MATGGHMHSVTGSQERKYLTLLCTEVYSTTWYIIHGLPKATFFFYIKKYNQQVLSGLLCNKASKWPYIGTLQAMVTISAIMAKYANQVPHQMQGMVQGKMDTLKFFP